VSINFSHAVFFPLPTLGVAGRGLLCVVWFGAVKFGASGANLSWPHIFKHQI
jgi:hypothetical protein